MWKLLRYGVIVTILMTSLMGCIRIPYKIPIQQGNLLPDEKIDAIHEGMTRDQITAMLGTPLLTNLYSSNPTIYIYTFKPTYGPYQRRVLRVYFSGDRVVRYTTE